MNRAFKIGIFDEEEKFISSIKSLQEKDFNIMMYLLPIRFMKYFIC